ATWCDAHHLRHWADGGPSDLENLALVCGRHHDAIHHGGWDVETGADGKPELRPPSWVDPDRRARRNRYWATQAEFHLR
ncbi:MAG TPA: HNH endonuclease signature motif containing protein, partial [Sporichthyaceae bacterium]|nr:HNH endonuclease signature motif containing protein [Sporichthyaceae bacterium]